MPRGPLAGSRTTIPGATHAACAPPSARRLSHGIIQWIGIGPASELPVAQVAQPLHQERCAALHEEELKLARQPPDLVGQEQSPPLLRPCASRPELPLRVWSAAHSAGVVLA